MIELNQLFQGADWKQEKHVPVIDAPDEIKKGELVKLAVTVGKQIAHPNTTEHHIKWISVYFIADGEKFPSEIARFEACAHGESTLGPNTSTIFTSAELCCSFKTEKSGIIFASSFCNIHGLWKSEKQLKVG